METKLEVVNEQEVLGKHAVTAIDSDTIKDSIERAQHWIEEQKAAREKAQQLTV